MYFYLNNLFKVCFNINAAHDFPWYLQEETWNPVNLDEPLYESGYVMPKNVKSRDLSKTIVAQFIG